MFRIRNPRSILYADFIVVSLPYLAAIPEPNGDQVRDIYITEPAVNNPRQRLRHRPQRQSLRLPISLPHPPLELPPVSSQLILLGFPNVHAV